MDTVMSKTRPIDKIIVHVSDSPDDRVSVDAAEIRRWHLQRGFKDIGYHYVIVKSGEVQAGRDVNVVGAHCEGENMFSIGICWVGRDDCNPAQRAALIKLIRGLMRAYPRVTVGDVYGHHHFNPAKTCPNLDMEILRADIAAASAT